MKTKKLIKALLGISFLTLGMVTVNDVKENTVVDAAEEKTASLNCAQVLPTNFTNINSTCGDIQYKCSASNTYKSPIRIYKNNILTVKGTMPTTLISKVEIVANNTTYANDTAGGTWSSGTATANSKNVTVVFSSPVNQFTFTASKSQVRWDSCTFTYTVSGSGHKVTFDSNDGSFVAEQTISDNGYVSEPVSPTKDGYDFLGWYTDETWATPWDFDTMAITKDTTIYARWQAEDPNQPKWTLVTDAADLAIGGKYIITNADDTVAMSTTQNENNRGLTAISSKSGVIKNKDLSSNVQQFTLEAGTVTDTYAFNTGAGYIYAASGSSNYLRTQTTNNANGSWTITIDDEGVATIKAQGSNAKNWLRYNSNNSIFSCYGSGQNDISLYKYFDPSAAYTVSFVNYEGGTEVAAQSVADGGKVNQPVALTREGYTFGGWYTDAAYSTAWDFSNDTVSGDITLYAKWTNDACEEKVKTYNGFANLAYKYTVTEQTYEAGYVKVTNASEIKDGSKIIVVSVVGENRYALTGATDGTPKNSLDCVSVSADENGYLTSYEGASEWTVSGSATDGYTLFDGTNYLTAANDTPLYAKETASDVKFNIVCAGENSYLTASGEHAVMYRNEPETNGEYFKHYKLVNIGNTGYASNVELYVENSDTTTKTIYTESEFRLQVGVNAAEMSSLLATLPAGAKYGIEVTAPVGIATQKQFTQEELEQRTSTDEATSATYNYTVISLKDVMNNLDRATVVFTVKVFVEYEGQIYYSDIAKEYSVASMVKAYYDTGDTRVSGLYNVLLENGIYNDAVEA